MSQQETKIVNVTDLDNSLLQSFSSFAVSQVGKRVAQFPATVKDNAAFKMLNQLEDLFYLFQPARKGSQEYLRQMIEIARDHQRPIEHIVFSARSHNHTETTSRRLDQLGLGQFISDIHLNGFGEINEAKADFVKKHLEEGCSVLVLEDDTESAQEIAEHEIHDEDVPPAHVYLLKNLTNRKARIKGTMHPRITIVNDLTEIPVDFKRKLASGVI